MSDVQNLDAPIWGAAAISRAANLYKKNPKTGQTEVDIRKGFYLLETGAIRAKQVKGRDKERGQWVSTLRQILESLGALA